MVECAIKIGNCMMSDFSYIKGTEIVRPGDPKYKHLSDFKNQSDTEWDKYVAEMDKRDMVIEYDDATDCFTIHNLRSDKVSEAMKIKGKWAHKPAIYINPTAVLRNRIVEFIGKHPQKRCPYNECMEFMKKLDEDAEIGRIPSNGYLTRNKHLFQEIKIGKIPYIKLTNIGERVYNQIKKNEGLGDNDDVDGAENIDGFVEIVDGLNEEWDYKGKFKENKIIFEDNIPPEVLTSYADDIKKKMIIKGIPGDPIPDTRIGGIVFHAPTFNAPDAPPSAQDMPAGADASAPGGGTPPAGGPVAEDDGIDIVELVSRVDQWLRDNYYLFNACMNYTHFYREYNKLSIPIKITGTSKVDPRRVTPEITSAIKNLVEKHGIFESKSGQGLNVPAYYPWKGDDYYSVIVNEDVTGDRVYHLTFGYGSVISMENTEKILVKFDNAGMKEVGADSLWLTEERNR